MTTSSFDARLQPLFMKTVLLVSGDCGLKAVGLYRVGQKMAQNFYMPITLSNIYRFSTFSHWWDQEKMCSDINTKNLSPHLIGVVTLPCEMSDIALKPLTTVTNCVINVDMSLTCGFQTAW